MFTFDPMEEFWGSRAEWELWLADFGMALRKLLGRARREVRDLGVILVGLAITTPIVQAVVNPHPTWPWSLVVVVIAVGVIGALLWVAGAMAPDPKDAQIERLRTEVDEWKGRFDRLSEEFHGLVRAKFTAPVKASPGVPLRGTSVGTTGAEAPADAGQTVTWDVPPAGPGPPGAHQPP